MFWLLCNTIFFVCCKTVLFCFFCRSNFQTYGSIFHWRRVNQGEDRMCSKSITNHWKSVRDVLAWFQRDIEILEVFTGYSIGFNILLCTYSLTQKCSLVTAEHVFSKSYYISAGHFSKVVWVKHVHKNKGDKLLFSSTSHCCRVQWVLACINRAKLCAECAMLLHAISRRVHRLADTNLRPCNLY